jgi:hypothetical protein
MLGVILRVGQLAVRLGRGLPALITKATGTCFPAGKLRNIVEYGINCRSIGDPAVSAACGACFFRIWGKVSDIDQSGFSIVDGAKTVRVIASDYGEIADGDFFSARGILDPTTNPPTLTCKGLFSVQRLHDEQAP